MDRRIDCRKDKTDSYVEVRIIFLIFLAVLALALILPAMIWASDWEGDNLPDSWKAQYGLGTNVYDPSDLVAWWQMEPSSTNTVTDRWTNHIDGAMTGFSANLYGAGLFSNSLSFTTNAEVNFSTNNALNAATNQFTFSTWFQATNSSDQPTTIATWINGQTNSWSLGADADGVAGVTFSDAVGDLQTIGPATNAVQLYDGTWHQVVVTYATNQIATVYIDGQNQASGTVTNWSNGPVASFTLGASETDATNSPFALDETRLYSRALGPQEVTQLPVTYTDLNGSGLTVFDDYLEGFNPLGTNTLVTSQFISSGLTGYYGTQVPTLIKSSGDGQTVAANTFEASPLVVQVTNGLGGPLANAPITFALASGSDGGLCQTSGGTTTVSVSLTTDASGNATIYYQAGPEALKNNTITATAVSGAGTATVCFSVRCGVQSGLEAWYKSDIGVTKDESGNVSNWADQTGNYPISQTGSAMPTYVANDINEKPALRFNSNQWLYNSGAIGSAISADMTMITVSESTNPTQNQYAIYLGALAEGQGRSQFYYQAHEYLDAYGVGCYGESVPPANTFVSEVTSLDSSRTGVTFYRNGVQQASSGISGLDNVGNGITVGAYGGGSGGGGWQGDIAEVLVYNHQLSSGELMHVDEYLADKYGYYSPNATWPLAYSSDVQAQITANQWNKGQSDAYVAFVATVPPAPAKGLSLWFKADAGVTADGSGNVSSWADQSPFGNNAGLGSSSPVTVLTQGAGGKPALHFAGNNYLVIPDASTLHPSYFTVLAVAQENSASTYQTLIGRGYRSTGWDAPYVTWFASLFGVNAGNYLRSAVGVAGNLDENNSNNTYSLSQPHVFGWKYDGTAQQVFLSGTLTGSTATSGVIDYSGGTANVCIGARSDASPWEYLIADVSEILVYDHALSDADQAQAEGYLADKYGLYDINATWPLAYSGDVQAQITANQWNKAQADAYAAFLATNPPVPAVGLALWLKADAGVTVDGSGNVTQWQDQSISANIVTQTASGVQPTLTTNSADKLPALSFNGSQRLVAPSSTIVPLNQDWTFITLGSSNDTNSERYMFSVGDGGVTGGLRALGNSGGQNLLAFWNSTASAGNYLSTGETGIVEAVYTQSIGQVAFYDRGNLAGTATASFSPTNSGLIVGDVTSGSYPRPWNGECQEILVYNRALSDTERQQVEVYLADKYGIYQPNATWPSSYSTAVQAEITRNQWTKAQADAYVAFLATSPAVPPVGLMVWFKPDAGITKDGSNNVTAWTDQRSGFTVVPNTATDPTWTANMLNGEPGLVFNGSQRLTSPDYVPLDQDFTIVACGVSNDTVGERYIADVGNPTGETRTLGNYDNVNIFGNYPNNVQAGQFLNVGEDNIVEGVYTKSNQTISFYERGNANGSGTIATNATSAGLNIGDVSNGSYPRFWDGTIHEVLIYNRALSTAERQQVEGYLADKYGYYNINATWPLSYSSDVQAQITLNQWTKAQAAAYAAFLTTDPPIPAAGLDVWLKAETGVTADGSGNVSAWADQGPAGNNAVQSSLGDQPAVVSSAINGLPALSFNGTSSYLTVTDNTSLRPAQMTVFAVGKTGGKTDYQPLLSKPYYNSSSWNSPYVAYALGIDPNSDPYFQCAISGTPLGAGSVNSVGINQPFLLCGGYNGSMGLLEVSGISQGTSSVSGSVDNGDSSRKDLVIGGASSSWLGQFFNGQISEILIYNRALTDTERQQIEIYLADKYGLYDPNATWLLAYSSDVQAQIVLNQWDKAQAENYAALLASNPDMLTDGLVLWLKADSGVTTDGSNNVTAWSDQSGNNSVSQSTLADEPSYVTNDVNGLPALRFNGSQWLTNPANFGPGLNADMTIIEVGSTSNPSAMQYAFFLGGTGTGQGRGIGYESNSNVFETTGIAYLAGAVPSANVFVLQAGVCYGPQNGATLYQNGANVGTGPLSGLQNVSSGITVGAWGGQSFGWQGDIAEILVYDHQLSSDEFAQVNLYLANKYNIGISVPGPVITPLPGSYGASQTITMSATAPTGATIRYTTDGSSPTASSTAYTDPFTLSSNALVEAAVFWTDGSQIGAVTTAQYAINSATPPSAPPTPTGLAVSVDAAGGALDLSWSIGSGTYDTINVYRSDNGGAYHLIATLDAGTTAYVDQTVVAGVNYQYEVGTLNEAGQATSSGTTETQPSANSPVGISVTTPSDAVALP